MPSNGTITTALSKIDGKGKASTKAIISAIENAGIDSKKIVNKKKGNK